MGDLSLKTIEKVDRAVYSTIVREIKRQQTQLELIASENFPSLAVLAAQGSVLTVKYAEGYPGQRYYGGCENYDVIERLAIERTKEVFKCEHANVQPHSGTQANMAVYFAVLNPGDAILGMHLAHGGHLSHGHPENFSGKFYFPIAAPLRRDDELIDYEETRRLAKKYRPRLIVSGSSSYSRIIDWKAFEEIAKEVDAYHMADIAHYAGLIAAGIYPSPIKHADFVTTSTHKTLRGPRGGIIMCKKDYAGRIDRSVFPGMQGGPQMHAIAAKAIALEEAKGAKFKKYQQKVINNARALAAALRELGYRIVSGGTDCHMFLVDLRARGITGKMAQEALEAEGIIVNKNSIPFDEQPPNITSGIRLGTPAVTTRGMGEREMEQIAELIHQALEGKKVKEKVIKLCKKFPIYEELLK